jgi:1-acyl-sn-glycerol-3-phosphate acyltransferase
MRPLHALVSWLTTLVFLPTFGAVMILFDIAQRLARLFGPRPQEYVAGAVQWLLVRTWGLCGTRLTVERDPGVRPWASYIIISNHQSMFDVVILGSLFFSNFPKYIAKRELGRWIPTVSYNLRAGGHVLIDRGDAPQAIAAIRELGRRVRAGRCSAMIFPEGTRARHGELGRFKPSGTMALLEEAPEVPIVPVTIDESWRLLRYGYLPIPFGVRVRVRLGAPITRRPDERPEELLEQVRSEMTSTLARWRIRVS